MEPEEYKVNFMKGKIETQKRQLEGKWKTKESIGKDEGAEKGTERI